MKTLFVFVDGLGFAPPSDHNPVRPEVCPTLFNLMQNHSVAIDANMDTDGLPQSATGQVALYTGVNAAQRMGRHQEGFPGPTLRTVIEETNLMKTLDQKGLSCCFADAYFADSIEDIRGRRFKSATTVMALTVPKIIRLTTDMLAGQAVMHDLTRRVIVPKGYTGPLCTPERSAEHLLHIALSHDFTLFEFFISDLAGHSQNTEQAESVLNSLDRFLAILLGSLNEKNILFILTSDHGNIEDLSVKGHTRNTIPLAALGPGSEILLRGAKNITDISPLLLRAISGNG